jgi:isochorismate synthase EntC
MEVHECGGEKSYTFYGISLNSLCECDHESKEHDKGCCNDKKTTVKAEKSEKQINKIIIAKNTLVDFDINYTTEFIVKDIIIHNPNSLVFYTKHPPNHSPPLYILYNVFLI